MVSVKFNAGLVRAMIAAVALVGLAGWAGSRIAPSVPLLIVIGYSILGAAALFVILTAMTIAWLTLMQFILRKGGTDSQWFWFASEPPGLVELRAAAREKKTSLRG